MKRKVYNWLVGEKKQNTKKIGFKTFVFVAELLVYFIFVRGKISVAKKSDNYNIPYSKFDKVSPLAWQVTRELR